MAAVLGVASRRIGRYELVTYLGSGGMGDVYAGVHTRLQKRVAVKLLKSSLRPDPEAVRRFLREGECAARVQHPNVVDVSDLGTDQGVPYLVMELLEGETLAKRLSRAGKLPVSTAIDIMLPILDALSAVHEAGVLHRDVKPANILLSRAVDGTVQPKLVDFGVARFCDPMATEDRALGTPHYMSPEQARGAALDPSSDQFSVASVLFELLTGSTPFIAETPESVLSLVARGGFPSLLDTAPLLPEELDAVVARAAADDPKERYPSTDALAQALLPFASARTQRLWLARATQHDPFPDVTPDTAADLAPPAPSFSSGPLSRSLALSMRALGAALLLAIGLVGGLVAATPAEPSARAMVDARGPVRSAAFAHATAPSEPAPPSTVRLSPPDAFAELDGVALGSGSFPRPVRDSGDALHALRVSAPGYVSQVVLFRRELPESTIALERIVR